MNFCDGGELVEALARAGFRTAEGNEPADVEVVNTCALTVRSVQKARMLVRQVRAGGPESIVIVTGCAARLAEGAFAGMKEADAVCASMGEVVDWVTARRGGGKPEPSTGRGDARRTRAFVKVQDGCEANCSYCVVPLVRGRAKSTPVEEAVRKIREAAERGHREVVICGIHLGWYGRDVGGESLAGLLERVGRVEGEFRVRLSSIEPLEVTGELLGVMAGSERFCAHLHLPMQSGSDAVLRAMGRPYTLADYERVVERARKALNNPAITTDIMVGFPGESEGDHERTVEAARGIGFARGHVFVYSAREGTHAAEMGGRVDARTARRRSSEVREGCARTAAAFRMSLVGSRANVLVERACGGEAEGLCERYQRVRVRTRSTRAGEVVRVFIVGEVTGQGILEGRLEEKAGAGEA